MTTTADNTRVYDMKEGKLQYPIDVSGSNDINAGDMVWFDTSAHLVKSVASDANAQYFTGIAEDTSYKNPFGTKRYDACLTVFYEGIFSMKTTNAESYYHGTIVGVGADAQTITTTTGTYPPGTVWNPMSTAVITGAAGTNVWVLINPRFPFLGA